MNGHPMPRRPQFRGLYDCLLASRAHFDEFKHLLSLYPDARDPGTPESERAAAVRLCMRDRIRAWTGTRFEGPTPEQLRTWRAIVVERSVEVSLDCVARSPRNSAVPVVGCEPKSHHTPRGPLARGC